jgi:hypothetical protein
MDDKELIKAINRLTDKLDSVSSSVGRGSNQTSSSGTPKNGPVPRAKAADATEKANREEIKKATKTIQALNKQTEEEIKASEKAVDAQQDLTKEQLKAKRIQEQTTDAFKDLGASMISADANMTTMLRSFSGSLLGTGSTFGKIVGGMAWGAGFAIGQLQEFAKNAADMGAFADLSKFSVGSITQMKLMSGLGAAFIKVIEESQGGFRAFGANSQEAAENLSNLSRGLKYGSSYLNSTMRNALGKDLVKSVDRAANAAAAMGMSEEERAKLMGAIARDAAYGAKDAQDAQQRFAKQMEDTVISTRKLSNTFGTSTRELQAAMQKFRETTAGRFSAATGNTGAVKIAPAVEAFGVTSDADLGARIAKALSEGDAGAARGALAEAGGNQSQFRALELLEQAIRGTNGGNDTDAFNKNIKALLPAMEALGMEGNRLAVNNADLAGPLAKLLDTATKIKTGDKDAGKAEPLTSEAKNIMAMNSLQAAIESLRNVLLGITATIATLATSLGAIALFGAGGGLFKGGLGSKLGDMFGGMFGKKMGTAGPAPGSFAGWKNGPTASAGGAGSGIMDKLSGAAGKGMEGFGDMLGKLGESKTVKGAATLALLGSALALTAVGLKTFNEVKWDSLAKGTIALGGLIGMARLVGEATTGIVKGAAAIAILGAAVLVSAVGFKTFNEVNWDSLVKGGLALGALAVSAQMIGNMTSSILKGALGIAALGAAMWVAGKGFQTFNDLNWEGIAKGAVALGVFAVAAGVMGAFLPVIAAGSLAIGALGLALGVFGAGAWVAAQAADVFANAIEKVGKIDGVNLIAVGAGLAAVGAGAVVFAAGMVAATATSLVTGLMSLFGAKSPMERILELVPVADKISMIGEGMFKFGSSIGLINENLKSLDLDALDNFKNALVEISNIDMPSLDGLSIPQISTDGIAGAPQQGNALSNVLSGNAAITPEVIGQLMSYLSNIENDLQAIRGNTRKNGYESPVRLS